MKFPKLLLILIFIQTDITIFAQLNEDSIQSSKDTTHRRLKILAVSEASFVTVSYTGFYYLWYKDYDKSKFHFFNDGKEWQGMDKFGHSFGAYRLSVFNAKAFDRTDLPHKMSAIWGSLSSFLYMSTIEIMDGYSAEWGASVWDLVANAGGTSLFLVQYLWLKKQVVMLKYSYYPSNYAVYRPNVFGRSLIEKMLKDYNATTFWLSINLNSIVSARIPPWLNLAVGYGATGMTGGFENYTSPGCNCKPIPDSERAREFYFSPDIDLSKFKVNSKFLKGLFIVVNSIKIPAPVIQYSRNKWQFLIR